MKPNPLQYEPVCRPGLPKQLFSRMGFRIASVILVAALFLLARDWLGYSPYSIEGDRPFRFLLMGGTYPMFRVFGSLVSGPIQDSIGLVVNGTGIYKLVHTVGNSYTVQVSLVHVSLGCLIYQTYLIWKLQRRSKEVLH